ncbi:MAG TPA: substrate-binding domain-containing protein [Rhizomicrobium sp.]|jgi:molybdate transport system substrate-binding protein|nr:substrate-binding domain-containing protein [Rhizomicrobium sp.]
MRLFVLTTAFTALLASTAFAQPTEINVFTPGVVYNSGLQDLAAAYAKETGIKVTVKSEGMSQLVNDVKKGTPIADIVVAPVSFMDGLQAEGSVVSGTAADIGRVYIGLAVKKGGAHPDISTPQKLGAALKAGGTVMYSNPANGSMEARIIDDMLHQYPYFQGVKTKISIKGEGGEALVRGEGDMALQLICEVLNHPELELVGTVPEELHAYIDTSVAVSARSTQADAAKAFIAYMLRPDHTAIWKAKGLERRP